LRQLFEQQPAQRGLAGADLAGQLDETAAAALADAVQQVRERVPVAFAQKHEARVGRDRERWLAEPVVVEIHPGGSADESASGALAEDRRRVAAGAAVLR